MVQDWSVPKTQYGFPAKVIELLIETYVSPHVNTFLFSWEFDQFQTSLHPRTATTGEYFISSITHIKSIGMNPQSIVLVVALP